MPRSLRGRLIAVVLLPLLAAWIAMSLALTVVLSGLHADAIKATLADTGQTLVFQFRAAALDRELRAIVTEVREAVAGTGTEVTLLRADGTYVDLGDATGTAVPAAPIRIPQDAVRGDTLTGSIGFTDGRDRLYSVTILRPVAGAGPRALVLSRVDRSRALAFADMLRVLPLVLVIGTGLGLFLIVPLARSVTGPLRRLADASADLPQTEHHAPLPLEGPVEVQDLTERFNAMVDALEGARAREAALLADLRHDLRTPLTVIGGYAAALTDGTAVGDDAVRAAETIAAEAARLERLVEELGAVERLRRGAEGLRPDPMDGREVIQSSLERFGAAAAAAGVEIETLDDLARSAGPDPGDGVAFVADRGAVERIMANLVSNALAAAPSPGGHIWLHAATGAGETVVLSVTDDGPGFPPGAAAKAFERFYRADPSRSGPGSGLGLAIVREFAAAHGGTAHAENVAPRGARVSVVLPRVPKPPRPLSSG